jgi:Transcriptional regulator, AbiEi antitoxin, Type IV TA system/Transcriptional regulator, AbiEi antitoxin N-terminal domain
MAFSLISKLQSGCPRGCPIDTAALGRLGISSALAHEYVASGWLTRLGRGVFMFAGDTLARDATLKFLQGRVLGLHVAGRTALAWQGYLQNITQREVLCLHGTAKSGLPNWFQERFPSRYTTTRVFDDGMPEGYGLAVLPESPNGPLVSAPERALLEMLSEVGVHQEAGEARGIMEAVRSVRLTEMGKLLQHCRMVKAARLCVVWAEELGLPWAVAARESAAGNLGQGRWIKQLKDGSNLILKP